MYKLPSELETLTNTKGVAAWLRTAKTFRDYHKLTSDTLTVNLAQKCIDNYEPITDIHQH